MNKVRFFNPGVSYLKNKKEYDSEMQRVLESGDLILRKDVEEFEKNLAEYVGTHYALGVASGTDALVLALKAVGIKPGDKILAPSHSFRATIEAIYHVGATPVLYDMDGKINITPDIDGIVFAHIAGEVAKNVKEVAEIAQNLGIPVIEDACQAIGAAPIVGDIACYSFYPAKILGGIGDGGGIATNNTDLYEELKKMRNHYKGDWTKVGYNSRLDNIQAAVLNIKIKLLPGFIKRRKEIAYKYNEAFKDLPLQLPEAREVYQDYIIELDERDALYEYLENSGVETMKNEYPYPNSVQKLPLSFRYELRSLRIPCNPDLTDEEVQHVIVAVRSFFENEI